MSNAARLYRYQARTSDGSAIRNIRVRADTSAATLTLGGQSNAEPASGGGSNNLLVVIQGRGGPKSKISHARTVTVRMTQAGGGLSIGSTVIVPVFQVARWEGYSVGQVGTIAGFACVCTVKTDGSPTTAGRSV